MRAVEGSLDDAPKELSSLLVILDPHVDVAPEVSAAILRGHERAAVVTRRPQVEVDEAQADQGATNHLLGISQPTLCRGRIWEPWDGIAIVDLVGVPTFQLKVGLLPMRSPRTIRHQRVLRGEMSKSACPTPREANLDSTKRSKSEPLKRVRAT